MSCNGCRVLRKGCSDDCALRPCLQWIKTPEAQGNATVFLAKFYGRAGLVNLINAGPEHLRHEIFRSLLYEACGRIINPIDGAVGLLYSGNWERCQAAVEAVLEGAPLTKFVSNDNNDNDILDAAGDEGHPIMPFKGCDIRHLGKNTNGLNTNFNNNNNVHKVMRSSRNRFKRSSGARGKYFGRVQSDQPQLTHEDMKEPTKFSITGWVDYDPSPTADNNNNNNLTITDDDRGGEVDYGRFLKRAPSHDSFSVETVEPSLVNPVQQGRVVKSENRQLHYLAAAAAAEKDDDDLVLDLTLGYSPAKRP